ARSSRERSQHPLLYLINTRCWLWDLSQAAGHTVTLDKVPDSQFEFWRGLGFTHVWLMGVWRTGPFGRKYSQALPELRKDPCYSGEEIGGSPYAIAGYEVPAEMGGNAALKAFRRKLADFGLKLILDFVPNHMAHDHPWVTERSSLFVQSRSERRGTFEVQ